MRTKSLLTILTFLLFFTAHKTLASRLELVSIEGLAEQIAGKQVLREIYNRLNIPIDITPRPAKRAIYETSLGSKDGEILRIWSYGDINPTLIRIPIPIGYIETQAFAHKDFQFNLKDKNKYTYAIVRGVQHTLDATITFNKITEFSEPSTMMSFVLHKRAEIALSSKLDGLYQLQKLKIYRIVPIGGVWETHPLYHYIHEKHKDLIPKITTVIIEMTNSGELHELWENAVEQLLKNASQQDDI